MFRIITLFIILSSSVFCQDFDSIRISRCREANYSNDGNIYDSIITYSKFFTGYHVEDSSTTYRLNSGLYADSIIRYSKVLFTYDNNKNLLCKRTVKLKDGIWTTFEVDSNKYDIAGRLIYHSYFYIPGYNGPYAYRTVYQFDNLGNKILQDYQTFTNQSFLSQTKFIWSYSGNMVLSCQKNINNQNSSLEAYKYNGVGLLSKTYFYDWSNGSLNKTKTTEIYYDDKNRDTLQINTDLWYIENFVKYYGPSNKVDSVKQYKDMVYSGITRYYYNAFADTDSIVYDIKNKETWAYNQARQILSYRKNPTWMHWVREDFQYSSSGKITFHKYAEDGGCGCYEEKFKYDTKDFLVYSESYNNGLHTGSSSICSYSYIIKKPTSQIENTSGSFLVIFPNPTNGTCNIILSRSSTAILRNKLGQEVKSYQFESGENAIDLNHLSSGIYFLEVQNNTERKIVKLVKN